MTAYKKKQQYADHKENLWQNEMDRYRKKIVGILEKNSSRYQRL